MNKFILLSLLPFALTANPVFNGSFELGTDGFALEKELRPASNPELKFIPLKLSTGAPGSGQFSLLVENPYAEYFAVFSREFKLKPSATYRFSAKVKAEKGGSPVCFRIFKVDGKWLAYPHTVKTERGWRSFSFTFTTEKQNGSGWYHILIAPTTHDVQHADSFQFDDLKLEEVGNPAAASVCAVAVPDKNLYYRGETAKLCLKVSNPSSSVFAQTLTVTGTDEYFGKQCFSEAVAVKLQPGETKKIELLPRRLERFGGFRIRIAGTGVNTLDQFFCVIGKYEAKPVDVTKDFVVGFNGGFACRMAPQLKSPAYTVYNAPLEARFELYSRIGCRILRDHDSGVRGVNWPAVEPERGKFDFSLLDRQLEICGKYKITLFPVIGDGFIENFRHYQPQRWPRWVLPLSERVKNDPPNCMPSVRGHIILPPKEFYRNYIYQTVKHVRGRIPVYEIANEPNLYLAPETYVSYLKEAYNAIREADPSAKISGFCLSSDFGAVPASWMNQCVKAGGLECIDILGFHPYGARELGARYPADKNIAELRQKMAEYGKRDIPVWNTELYYLVEGVNHRYYNESRCRPHEVVCRFLVDLGEGLGQSITINENQIWKRILTPNRLAGDENFHELILSENAVAYNAVARLFEAAEPVRKIRYSNGAICYVYRKEGKLIAAVWQYRRKKGVRADFSPFEVMDVFGNPEVPEEKEIGPAPYYLCPGTLDDAEFLAKLERLPIRLEQPVSTGELARKVGNSVFLSLYNDSDVEQKGLAGITGGGLTAQKPQSFTLNPKAVQSIEIPGKNVVNDGSPLTLMLHVNGNVFRIPLKLVENKLIPRVFKMENAEGEIAFGNGEIKVEMRVKDASGSGPSGNRKPWETDCVELFFDLAPFFLPQTHAQEYTPKTFRVFVTPRDAEKLHTSGAVKPADCRLDVKQNADGYSFILVIRAKTGSALGFDLKIDDSDGSKIRETTLGSGTELHKKRCNFSIAAERN